MADFSRESTIVITCPRDIAPILAKEVEALGYKPTNVQIAFVELQGNMYDCMKLNLWLRTAHKVLYKIKDFTATNPDELYAAMSKIPWEKLISHQGYFSIISRVQNDTILDTRFASLRAKDAIADRIKEKMGERPDSGSEKDDAVFFLHWEQDQASVYIDTSGETIAKHGYRKIPHTAPMQETLAAAVVLSTGWKPGTAFINPMCGSGTLAIEAALIACNVAPGLFRGNYGFMHILGYDDQAWNKMLDEAEAAEKELEGKFILSDIDPVAIDAASKNAALAGFKWELDFMVCSYEKTEIPQDNKGIVIFNPEYGERLGNVDSLNVTYKELGDFLKNECKGYLGYIFTGNLDLAKKIGLKPKRRIPFHNGTIEARLLEYELYEGSRKPIKTNE
jgi:23S rRNA G2445 N2-methylase RlmL